MGGSGQSVRGVVQLDVIVWQDGQSDEGWSYGCHVGDNVEEWGR